MRKNQETSKIKIYLSNTARHARWNGAGVKINCSAQSVSLGMVSFENMLYIMPYSPRLRLLKQAKFLKNGTDHKPAVLYSVVDRRLSNVCYDEMPVMGLGFSNEQKLANV